MRILAIALFLLSLGVFSAEPTGIFGKSLSDGLDSIKSGNIEMSMNLLRRGINCFGIENGKYDVELFNSANNRLLHEVDKPKRAAYLVYLAVIEITNPDKNIAKVIEYLNNAENEDKTLP